MAAAVLTPVVEGAGQVAAEAKAKFDDWSKDPVMNTATGLVKWGSVAAVSGGLMWGVSKPLLDQAQRSEWDMEDALGLPRTTPPSLAPPPPLPPAQALFDKIVGEVANPDNTNAANAQHQFGIGAADITVLGKMLTNSGKQTAPGQVGQSLINASLNCELAIESLGKTPNTDWSGAQAQTKNLHENLNSVGFEMGWGQPFQIPQPGIPSGWWSPFVAVLQVESSVGLTIGKDAGAVVAGLKTIGSDIGTGLGVLGQFLLNAPRVLWDAFSYVTTWGLGEIFANVGPWLFGAGVAMAAIGLTIRQFYPKGKSRVQLLANARGARLWNWIDRKIGTRKAAATVWEEKQTEADITAANTPPVYAQAPTVVPGLKVDLPGTRTGAKLRKPHPDALVRRLSAQPGPPVAPPGPPAVSKPPPPPKEKTVPTPTAETEAVLGERGSRAPSPEELRKIAEESEKNRVASMPAEPPRPPNAREVKEEEQSKAAEEAARRVKVREAYRTYKADDVLAAADTFEERQFLDAEKNRKRHKREYLTRNLVMSGAL